MMDENVILNDLDSRQKEAVIHTDGPSLIVAGAGSGKTRVLTSRIAWLLCKGADPSRILALTFTRKAAGEMKERIAVMAGPALARKLCMGTFHSVFVRFLRQYHELLGYPQDFTIYDTSDSTSAIKHCVKELQLDEKVYKPKEVLSRISMAKNNLCTWEAYAANTAAITNDRQARKPEIHRIYAKYQQVMLSSGVMDFDDILLNMNRLLTLKDASGEPVLNQIAGLFDYVLVDEYQDTNLSQYLILRKLCQFHRNICVVGDDSQSIYAFRGAKIENMLNFKKDYPEMKLFSLECNYRSTENIVAAANTLIARNAARIPKNCFSSREAGEKITMVKAYSESEEASSIASSIIRRIREDGAAYQDFGILYRTNAQSRAIEEALRKRNLPYFIFSGNSFYERAEIKDMMAYFKLVVNPRDDEAFRRVINKPARGIGDTSLAVIATVASAEGKSFFEAACSDSLEEYGIKSGALGKIREFTAMILAHNALLDGKDAYSLALSIAEKSGLYRFFKEDNSIEGQSRLANIDELLNSVKGHIEERNNSYIEDMIADGQINDASAVAAESLPMVSMSDYLESTALISANDVSDESTSNRIALMTVHSAKGLEFPYVFVAGMEENLFPSGGMMITPQELEEERRLFYVAMTRAKQALCLSFATTRMRNGKHESNSPSRFLKEIDSKYIANPYVVQEIPDGDDDGLVSRLLRGGSFGQPRSAEADRHARSFDDSRHARPFDDSRHARPDRASVPDRRPAYVAGSGPRTLRRVDAPIPKTEDFVPDSPLDLRSGMRIEHNRFGLGNIVSITGDPAALKATIKFDSYGEKVLLLQYAKIRIVR